MYQDNQSAMKLENNGRQSSGKCTRHINIRYFFVTDRIKNGEVCVEYCSNELLIADIYTKPLQGALFCKIRKIILNLDDDACDLNEVDNKSKSYKKALLNHKVTTSQECVENNVETKANI